MRKFFSGSFTAILRLSQGLAVEVGPCSSLLTLLTSRGLPAGYIAIAASPPHFVLVRVLLINLALSFLLSSLLNLAAKMPRPPAYAVTEAIMRVITKTPFGAMRPMVSTPCMAARCGFCAKVHTVVIHHFALLSLEHYRDDSHPAGGGRVD